jgi:hypothetical protein
MINYYLQIISYFFNNSWKLIIPELENRRLNLEFCFLGEFKYVTDYLSAHKFFG